MRRRRALLVTGVLVLVALFAAFRLNHDPGDPASAARQAIMGGVAPAFCDPALAALFAQPGAAGQTSGDVQVQVTSRSASAAEVRVQGWAVGGSARLDWTVRAERRAGRWCVASITANPTL